MLDRGFMPIQQFDQLTNWRNRYPETCGKTIEEVEELFKKGAPPAWKTKKGESRLVAQVEAVQEAKDHGKLDEVLGDAPLPGTTGEKGVTDTAGRRN